MRKCSKKIKHKTYFNEKVLKKDKTSNIFQWESVQKKIKHKTYFNEKVFKKDKT